MALLDRLRSASPARQLQLLVLGVVLLSTIFALIYVYGIRTPYSVLFSNLRPADAATIVAELDKKKIPYRLLDDGATVLAPTDIIAKTRLDLMTTELPLKGTVGFELFNKSDMGLTEFAQQINYQRALQGELERTIMSLDSVDQARVHLALPEHSIFSDEMKAPKASVILLTRPGQGLGASAIRGVQRLVAAAVPDLDVDDVVVLDGKGAVVSDPAQGDGAKGAASGRRFIEESFESRVRQALQESFPTQNFDVTVWASSGVAVFGSSGPVTATPSDDGPSARGVGEGRSYSLRVSVTADRPLDTPAENAIRNVVQGAINADSGRGDLVMIASSLAPSSAQTPAKFSPPVASKVPPIAQDLIGNEVRTGLFVIMGVLIVALALIWRGGGRSLDRMNERQRQKYVARLRTLLQAGETDAAR